MRTNLFKLMMALCLIIVFAGWGKVQAGEMAKEEQTAVQPPAPPAPGGPMMEMTPEQADKMLAEIKETRPQKAEELAQLKEKDPNAFKNELRKAMREHFMMKMREQRGEPGKQPQGGPDGMKTGTPGPGGQQWGGHGGPEMMREWMKEKHEEYMKWLKENYPDESTKLEKLKDENPDQFFRAVMVSGRKYWPIFQASKDNPPLASVMKEQLTLKEKRMDLVKQIKATTDEKQKKELTGQLETVVGQQFDLIVKRKQIALDDLTKKLTDLQKEVDNKKSDVEKWKGKDYKNQQIKQRVNELLSEKEKFEWE
jgi:hypothetical protein